MSHLPDQPDMGTHRSVAVIKATQEWQSNLRRLPSSSVGVRPGVTCHVGSRNTARTPLRGAAGVVAVELQGMGSSEATTVDAGGRDLRVSSPDRVIFPETERSGAVTKLDVVKYYLAVADGIMRALERRPTTLERWPKGVHPGIVLSTREKGGGDALFQKRIPRGAPDYVQTARIQFPSGRHADEICPTDVAVVGWAAQMGTITFHPWPVR